MTTASSVRFQVEGRVQGVGFRAATQRRATTLGLGGWVRNEPDGSVSGVARGPTEALTQFRDWLAKGPPNAQVVAVHWQADTEPAPVDEGFLVRR